MTRRAWLLTYPDGKTRIIWAEFREVLPSGAVVFYDTDPVDRTKAVHHIYAVATGHWKDVQLNPSLSFVGDLETLGTPTREVSKRRH